MSLFKYFFKQITNHRSFSLLFIVNLSLGLCGFISLDLFKNSIDGAFKSRSKVILGADFGLSSRRPLTQKEVDNVLQLAGSSARSSSMVEVYSMVAGPTKKSKLVQVKAIDDQFPFYGQITLETQNNEKLINQSQSQKGSGSDLQIKKVAWIYPELIAQLAVKVGQEIKIGDSLFLVQAVVKDDSGQGISTSMAPRIYIGLNQLEATGLIQFGTVAWYSQVFKTPKLNEKQLKQLKINFDKQQTVSDVKSYTDQDVSEQTSRLLAYLNDFLGLASVATLFLAFVGGVFLFRSYVLSQLASFGIYLSLGLTFRQTFFYQLLLLAVLGFISACVALVLGTVLLPGLQLITKELLPVVVQSTWSLSSVMTIFCLGMLGAVCVGLPLLMSIREIKPKLLFSGSIHKMASRFDALVVLSFLPSLLLIWALAIWQANSFKIGSLFTLSFFLSSLVLVLFGFLLTQFVFYSGFKRLSLRWSFRDLSRFKVTSVTIFLCLGLGMLLINLIPQIKASIDHELSMPKDSKLPSFFMFDIQEEQLPKLNEMLSESKIELQQISPMVRARLVKVNDKDFSELQIQGEDLSREQQRQQQSRNRGYNLSYRSDLGIGEELFLGKPFSGTFDESQGKNAEISLERRFAERLNIKIGDRLQFSVQGVELSGEVVNLRSVRWTTFQPNFFILFQPGVLELAPKTYLASVPKLGVQKTSFQDKIVEKLPNVSMIDVSRLVEKLKGIIQQMGLALQFMTFICLCAGFVVLFSIANFQARKRSWDIALLKAMGASFSDIKKMFLWQFLILSLLASLFGVFLSLIFSYFFSRLLFETTWVVDWKVPVITVFVALVMTYLVTLWATNKFLSVRSAQLLGLNSNN